MVPEVTKAMLQKAMYIAENASQGRFVVAPITVSSLLNSFLNDLLLKGGLASRIGLTTTNNVALRTRCTLL